MDTALDNPIVPDSLLESVPLKIPDGFYAKYVHTASEQLAAEKARDVQQAYEWNIRPSDGVDVFSLLRPCEVPLERVWMCDIEREIGRLRKNFELCNNELLQSRTDYLFPNVIRCDLCNIDGLHNGSELIKHFLDVFHQKQLKSPATWRHFNKAALCFWIEAVTTCARNEESSMEDSVSGIISRITMRVDELSITKPDNQIEERTEPVFEEEDFDIFDILRPCELPIHRVLVCNVDAEISNLRTKYDLCDKKRLRILFPNPIRCSLCKKSVLHNASDLISHFLGSTHQQMMKSDVGQRHFHRKALSYWMSWIDSPMMRPTVANPPQTTEDTPKKRIFAHKLTYRHRLHSDSNLAFSLFHIFAFICFFLLLGYIQTFPVLEHLTPFLGGWLILTMAKNRSFIENELLRPIEYLIADGIADLAGAYLRYIGELP